MVLITTVVEAMKDTKAMKDMTGTEGKFESSGMREFGSSSEPVIQDFLAQRHQATKILSP